MSVNVERIDDAARFRFSLPSGIISNPELQPTAQAFLKNFERLKLFSTLPTSLIGLAANLQSAWCERTHAVHGMQIEDIVVATKE